MKKREFLRFLVLGTAGFLMVSCGKLGGAGKWAADENSIYVTKDLQVQSAMVFTAPEANELYSRDELAAEAGEWIRDYNVAKGRRRLLRTPTAGRNSRWRLSPAAWKGRPES